MARDDLDQDDLMMLDEGELEGEVDNARALTSGLVITTFVVMLAALVVMEMALAPYGIGPFAG